MPNWRAFYLMHFCVNCDVIVAAGFYFMYVSLALSLFHPYKFTLSLLFICIRKFSNRKPIPKYNEPKKKKNKYLSIIHTRTCAIFVLSIRHGTESTDYQHHMRWCLWILVDAGMFNVWNMNWTQFLFINIQLIITKHKQNRRSNGICECAFHFL